MGRSRPRGKDNKNQRNEMSGTGRQPGRSWNDEGGRKQRRAETRQGVPLLASQAGDAEWMSVRVRLCGVWVGYV